MSTPKWREPKIDPFSISFPTELKLISIDGFPHAGNDVFECSGIYKNNTIKFFLKVARHIDADISNEVTILKELQHSNIPVPEIIAYDIEGEYPYIATLSIEGERLSSILSICEESLIIQNSLKYMEKFGESLGRIHSLNFSWNPVKPRRFHERVNREILTEGYFLEIDKWLVENEPKEKEQIFIHGDHHYANLLWYDGKLSSVLDWELCGMGWKEFDLAWAIILRPCQKFLKSQEEQNAFLEGYSRYCSFNIESFNWCKVLIYTHFYEIGRKSGNNEYMEFVLNEMYKIMNIRRF